VTAHAAPARVTVTSAGRLPAPVQLPAVAARGAAVLAMGGLDAADASVASIIRVDARGARQVGALPAARHDAAAATIGRDVYVAGGGDAGTASAAILRVHAGGATQVGSLPVVASDVAAASIGHTLYVVGGYTETAPLRSIVAFTPGSPARVVGRLPQPLRYGAVAAVDGRVLIAGGTSGTHADIAILRFDPLTGRVRRIGTLPAPLTHAAAAALGGTFYSLGGRTASPTGQRDEVLAVDPRTGAVHRAGRLPIALSDIGAARAGGRILALGGRDAQGRVHDEVWRITPR
jgi:N-acetylneuraminic acid mutarotase